MKDDEPLWIWEIVLYDKVFCSGERCSEQDAIRAAKDYIKKNLTDNTKLDAHVYVRPASITQ